MVAKQTPSSCRNGTASIMLSSNGTPIYVNTMVIPHNPRATAFGTGSYGGGAGDTTWAVKVTRSSPAELVTQRCLQLLVSSDGTIKWARPGTPTSLFGLDPTALLGTSLSAIVDVFAEYSSGGCSFWCKEWRTGAGIC